jgi:acyl-CoA reductase-like NAD-dependent aldehyde dehydrogenase
MLSIVAEQLRRGPVAQELRAHLDALAEMELRATGSWSLVATAQTEWVDRAIEYLDRHARALPEAERPDQYWADDVVAGVIASVKGIIGADDLYSRIEAQYAGQGRPPKPRDD